jgi:hypothetical protein
VRPQRRPRVRTAASPALTCVCPTPPGAVRHGARTRTVNETTNVRVTERIDAQVVEGLSGGADQLLRASSSRVSRAAALAWCLNCFCLRLPVATRLGGMTCPVGGSMRSTTVALAEAGAGAAHSALTRDDASTTHRVRGSGASLRTRAPIEPPSGVTATRFSIR